MSVAVVVGSAFDGLELPLEPVRVTTPFGEVVLHRAPRGWVLFRHGRPHQWLPNHIPYRAHTAALQQVGVKSLVVTSSVGLLQPDLPLLTPMMVEDLVWLDNRLPDGSAATMWPVPSPEHGHLVVEHGLFDPGLSDAVRQIAQRAQVALHDRPVTFWYAPGPRTKTAAENRVLARMGLDVNSMTFAPEVVLAAELEMTVAGVVVGHKPSGPGMGTQAVAASLDDARVAMERLVVALLMELQPVPARNPVYRFA